LENVEVKDHYGANKIHAEELEYLCKLNACGRGKVRASEVSKSGFVKLLANIRDREDVGDRNVVTSLLYGLLREKPHLWCVI
jgi:hypothetical protein